MRRPFPDLSAPLWSGALALQLERASHAIATLNARISISPVAETWRHRAPWSGMATALQFEGAEIDEKDIFCLDTGHILPGRPPPPSRIWDQQLLDTWRKSLIAPRTLHWREDLPFRFDAPDDWDERPALLRALELTARHARAIPGPAAWLALPRLLFALGLTQTPLACLVTGDKMLRLSPAGSVDALPRMMKRLERAAVEALDRLKTSEALRQRTQTILATETRPGMLREAVALMSRGMAGPKEVTAALGLSISGAGKLLARTEGLGLAVEITGRRAWRAYMPHDLALAFDYARRPVGRPPSPAHSLPARLDPVLAAFDAEMAAITARLEALGIAHDA